MKKKIASYLLTASMLIPSTIALSACGGGDDDGEHTHSWSAWETTTEASCTADGKKTRKCSGCNEKEEEKIPATGHSYNQGDCDVCGADDPNWDDTLVDSRVLQNISITDAGVLRWTGLRVASKYVLSLTDIGGTAHTYTIPKETRSVDLTALTDNYTLGFGKNSATLTAYETLEVEIDDEIYEQEVPISTATDTFDIVNINAGYSISRKTYIDEYVTIKDFYSNTYHDDTYGDYILYEKQLGSSSTVKFPLYNRITPIDSNYSVYIYESEYDKEQGNVFNEGSYNSNVIVLEGGEKQWVYIDIEDELGNVVKSYTALLYCTRSLNVQVYSVTRTTPDSNGDILVTEESYTSSLSNTTVWENDILDINMIYDSIPTGMLLRDKNYNIYEKDTDYNTKDMILSGTNLILYFSNETEVREHHAEIEAYSDLFTLEYSTTGYDNQPPYWSIKYNDNHNDETVVVPSRIIGYSTEISTSTFYNTGIRYLVFEPGITSLPSRALYTCNSLVSVSIPSTVTFMGDNMLSPSLSSPKIYLEGSESSMNGSDTMWNRKGSTTTMYSYYQYQTGCCSTVTKNNVKVKVNNTKGTASVVGTTGVDITIPEKVKFGIKEYTVTSIESLNGASLTTVTIPKTITSITLSSIPSSLTEIIVDSENEKYSSYEGLLYNKNMSNVLYIPKSITELTLSENITSISGSLYNNLESLTTINLHSNITSIENPIFSGCTAVTTYNVDSENTTYSSLNGHLYNKEGNELIRFAIDSSDSAVVSETVTKIHKGAFTGYTQSAITLPFIGESATTNKYFGYIFGLNSYSNHSSLPSTLTSVEITSESNIADYAFYRCTKLTSITIKGTATEIGASAFSDCSGITTMIFDTAVTNIDNYAFSSCTNLTNLTLDNTVTNIGKSAFYNCSKLNYDLSYLENLTTVGDGAFTNSLKNTALIIPKKLVTFENGFKNSYITSVIFQDDGEITSIPSQAFYGCSYLTSVTFKPYIKSIGQSAFYNTKLNSISLNDGLETIGSSAFYQTNNTTITELIIPDSVTSIGNNAFSGLKSLQSLTIPFVGTSRSVSGKLEGLITKTTTLKTLTITNATTIAAVAFAEWSIEEVSLNEGITSIGNNAFAENPSLKSVLIPATVISIGEYAFYYCSSLETISFATGSQLETIGNYAFAGQGESYANAKLTTFSLPNSVKTIGDHAFEYSKLATITISMTESSLETIGKYAFQGTELTEIIIPNSLKTIDAGAFYYLDTLTTVTVSQDNSTLETIGTNAFIECNSLTEMYFPSTLTSIGINAFYSCNKFSGYNKVLTIPKSITRIEDGVFYGTLLNTVNLHDDITYIGNYAFQYAGTISTQFINTDNESLGKYKVFILPKALKYVGSYALASYADLIIRFTDDNMTNLTTVAKNGFAPNTSNTDGMKLLFDTIPTTIPVGWDSTWATNCTKYSRVQNMDECTTGSKTWFYNGSLLIIENLSQPKFS